MTRYIASVDQGTTSTRFMIFDDAGAVVGAHQLEHKQIYPHPGWVEHDPVEIWDRTQEVVQRRCVVRRDGRILGVGITNQRETVVAWDAHTGRPACNAIVWQDTRTEPDCRELIKRT